MIVCRRPNDFANIQTPNLALPVMLFATTVLPIGKKDDAIAP